MIEEGLKRLIEQEFGTIKSFSEHIGLAYTTVRSILERGILNAKVENVIKIADGLQLKPEDLVNYNRLDIETLSDKKKLLAEIDAIIHQLNNHYLEKVSKYSEEQLTKQRNLKILGKTAAGPEGITNGDLLNEELTTTDIPRKADCALIIQGDSMEPDFKNGSIVFYREQPVIENGEVGIIEIDGAVTLKKFYHDSDTNLITLKSINPKYKPFTVDSSKEIKILGVAVK